jgi:hypothetical protein
MPLSFNTESHGEIPIGFFNIDTDMILINNYFVFATDFCEWLKSWAEGKDDIKTKVEMYIIEKTVDIGNLMGAIAGRVFIGFIGEVYKKFPFPEKSEDFKQKPEGFKNRKVIENIIKSFSQKKEVEIVISKDAGTITIGEYIFTPSQFHEVIGYIWRGGMPMWRDDEPPDYVKDMMRAVIGSKHWLFKVPEQGK